MAGAAWGAEIPIRSVLSPQRIAATGQAVGEANWLFQQLGVNGRASRADALDAAARRAAYGPQDALLFAYSLNELPAETRSQALAIVVGAVADGATLLVIEPIGKRLGNAAWWEEWRAALGPRGVIEKEWRFSNALLPESTRRLARAAGLDPKELTARGLLSA